MLVRTIAYHFVLCALGVGGRDHRARGWLAHARLHWMVPLGVQRWARVPQAGRPVSSWLDAVARVAHQINDQSIAFRDRLSVLLSATNHLYIYLYTHTVCSSHHSATPFVAVAAPSRLLPVKKLRPSWLPMSYTPFLHRWCILMMKN